MTPTAHHRLSSKPKLRWHAKTTDREKINKKFERANTVRVKKKKKVF